MIPKPARAGVFSVLEDRLLRVRASGQTVIPLHIGDTFLEPPQHIGPPLDSVPGLYSYGQTSGLSRLKEALLARSFPNTDIHVTAGATHGLFCAVSAALSPGDDVLSIAPYWPLSPGVFETAGARVVDVPFSTEHLLGEGPSLTHALEKALTRKTRAVYFASPNNPDGIVWSKEQLEELLLFAVRHELWIFADEVYERMAFDAPHRSMLELPGALERTIAIYSLSKSHALAGIRVGYVMARPEVVAAIRRLSTHSIFNVPEWCQWRALSALQNEKEWLANAHAVYGEARLRVRERLQSHRLPYVMGGGAAYAFVSASKVLRQRSMTSFLEHAIDHGVLLTPGAASGAAYESWARICVSARPLAEVLDGIERLAKAYHSFES